MIHKIDWIKSYIVFYTQLHEFFLFHISNFLFQEHISF